MNKQFGDINSPLLFSVRSGAAESMPGMMDTILNLGLNDESVKGLASSTSNERFAFDSYRRFIQMFANAWIKRRKLSKRSEEHTSELQTRFDLVCRLLLEKKKNT